MSNQNSNEHPVHWKKSNLEAHYIAPGQSDRQVVLQNAEKPRSYYPDIFFVFC